MKVSGNKVAASKLQATKKPKQEAVPKVANQALMDVNRKCSTILLLLCVGGCEERKRGKTKETVSE